MRLSGHSDGDVKMDIVQLLIDGFFILYLGSFVVGMIIGALIPIGLLLFPKTTLSCLETFLRYNIEYNEYTLNRLEELK